MTKAPRLSRLLVASLALTASSLVLPLALVGPLVATVLALLGHRRVRKSGGALRSPALALAAMAAALVVFAAQGWVLVRAAPRAAAQIGMQGQTARVEAALRSGTAEGAFDLLSPAARQGTDRAKFVESLRAAFARLGALRSLGDPRERGAGWDRTGTFLEGDAVDLRLGWAFDAEFERGKGTVTLEVEVRRRGRAVEVDLVSLGVSPL